MWSVILSFKISTDGSAYKATLLPVIVRIQGIVGEQFGKNCHGQKPLEKVHTIETSPLTP